MKNRNKKPLNLIQITAVKPGNHSFDVWKTNQHRSGWSSNPPSHDGCFPTVSATVAWNNKVLRKLIYLSGVLWRSLLVLLQKPKCKTFDFIYKILYPLVTAREPVSLSRSPTASRSHGRPLASPLFFSSQELKSVRPLDGEAPCSRTLTTIVVSHLITKARLKDKKLHGYSSGDTDSHDRLDLLRKKNLCADWWFWTNTAVLHQFLPPLREDELSFNS